MLAALPFGNNINRVVRVSARGEERTKEEQEATAVL